ncbi:hypothetical protein BREVNS_0305 [Brevinematales bacterium NS]|jgi:hypothetical protein|nr:hypothetical protein [Brevinematales bacterium]QJR21055.1 hypothetical protein BREVNS_0305 [Brevinematales bacterium NS]
MDLQELRCYLNNLVAQLENQDNSLLKKELKKLSSVFPFNEYEFILTFLVSRGTLNFDDYKELREKYVFANLYLDLYSLAPRIFGQVWGEQHVRAIDARFMKPNKSVDPNYKGQYDLYIQKESKIVRIEVKAARATATKKRGDVVSRALRRNATEPFWLNFQQLKPEICDVFIFIGVWVDEILYWVMSAKEVEQNRHFSHQHRGGIEYQIGITHKNIKDFDVYKVEKKNLYDSVINKVV